MGLPCLLTLLGVVFLTLSCTTPEPEDPIKTLYDSGKLIVLTRNAPTTYYEGREGEWEGFEHDLVTAFAESQGLKVSFVVKDSTAEILEAIENNEGHIAAAGLTRTPERDALHLFGPDYLNVYQEVVCNNLASRPRGVHTLEERSIVVIGNSSYTERLQQLQEIYPGITWTATYDEETEQIMDQVWQGEVDCTIADSNIVEINRRYFPELRVGLRLSEKQPLAWVVAPRYESLQQTLHQWWQTTEQQWLLTDLEQRYFGHVEIFDYVDIKRFNQRLKNRLPKIEKFFHDAHDRYGVSWTLLAAQAYQESHWNPGAVSPTGVRGIMMLTQRTARQLGVINRLDPEQSILGGALYLKQIQERLPDNIVEPDRTWIALACYNVGYGHVMDARRLATEQGLNPDAWSDLLQTLPLLSKPKYYKRLRHGYARGREPVRYVQRIRDFKDLLERRIDDETYSTVTN